MEMPNFRTQTRIVGWSLIAWGAALAALGIAFFDADLWWPIAVFALAGLNLLLGILGLRVGRWVVPLFLSLYSLPLASLVLGAVTRIDIHVAAGVLALCVVTVGLCLLQALHRIAPPWTSSPAQPPAVPPVGASEREEAPAPWTRKAAGAETGNVARDDAGVSPLR